MHRGDIWWLLLGKYNQSSFPIEISINPLILFNYHRDSGISLSKSNTDVLDYVIEDRGSRGKAVKTRFNQGRNNVNVTT